MKTEAQIRPDGDGDDTNFTTDGDWEKIWNSCKFVKFVSLGSSSPHTHTDKDGTTRICTNFKFECGLSLQGVCHRLSIRVIRVIRGQTVLIPPLALRSPRLRVFVTDCVPAALQSVVRSFGLARFAEIQARFREIVARFAEMDARFPEIRISPNLGKFRQISAILAKTQGGENFAPQIDSQSPPTLYLPLTEPSTK